jgi:hypothetical protein
MAQSAPEARRIMAPADETWVSVHKLYQSAIIIAFLAGIAVAKLL